MKLADMTADEFAAECNRTAAVLDESDQSAHAATVLRHAAAMIEAQAFVLAGYRGTNHG